jgi:hypothetical protein
MCWLVRLHSPGRVTSSVLTLFRRLLPHVSQYLIQYCRGYRVDFNRPPVVPYCRYHRTCPLRHGCCFLSCKRQRDESAYCENIRLLYVDLETFAAARRYLAVVVVLPFLRVLVRDCNHSRLQRRKSILEREPRLGRYREQSVLVNRHEPGL